MKHTDKVMAKKNKKPTINDLLEDMESMMEFVNDIGNKSIEELNVEEIDSKTKHFKEKYKDILPKESEEDLDSKK
tara:strand:+ start:183 stop:407 length:225 start_codon:yes stop_codon:yes gene_type:complete